MTARMVTCPSCKTRTFTQDAPWKLLCVTCYVASKRRTPEPVPVVHAGAGIEPDMLRRLIQLTQPDKHDNSEASNVATRFLLALRKEAKA